MDELEGVERYAGALEGKVALVTGAGRGIGRAIAAAYGRAGARVCCAARTLSEVEAAVSQIEEHGGSGLAISADVACRADVERMVSECVAQLGGLDILVLNAGINGDRRSVADSVVEAWRRTLEVDLFGPYYCAKAAIPHLIASGAGKIITIGSGIGHKARPNISAYACAKAGLWALTQALAQELVEHNISVNELIPGPVITSMTTDLVREQSSVFGIGGEWQKAPDDVTPLALFLATQPNVGPTGQSFSLMRRVN
jgi:3-oxoacyl-[acyl-carrier protein] reductase